MLKKSCWVITDGKQGTVNQCIGLAENLAENFTIKTIQLKKVWDILNPYIRIDAINPCKKSLGKTLPKIAIVSGRKAVSVGLHIKKKSPETILICVQDPRVARDKFDFIILPEHDKYRSEKNVILTKGAMHKWTKAKIDKEGKKIKLPTLKYKKNICVLIGGTSKNHTMTIKNTQLICQQIQYAQEKLKANVYLTASRRTPPHCLKLMQKTLTENCYIWDNNGENPLFGMLAKGDYIFVTNDSVSMISEATSTGKPIFLLKLDGKAAKIERFIDGLRNDGIIKDFEKDVLKAYKYTPINNAKTVAKVIEKVLKDGRKN
jgi:hypothetical protein